MPGEETIVEENYGKKIGEAKPLPLAVSGMLMVAFIFLIAGISVMGYGISKGTFGSMAGTAFHYAGGWHCAAGLLHQDHHGQGHLL